MLIKTCMVKIWWCDLFGPIKVISILLPLKFKPDAPVGTRPAVEIKESLLTKRDKPVLNKNISCARLFLFDN